MADIIGVSQVNTDSKIFFKFLKLTKLSRVEIESGIQPGPDRIAPLKVGRWSGNPIGIRLETSRCFGRIPAMESGGEPVG